MDTLRKVLDTEDYTSSFSEKERENGKLYSIVGYFWVFFFIPLLVKGNKFCKFHANQGLVFFLFSLCGGIIITLLSNLFNVLSLNVVSIIFKALFSLTLMLLLCFGVINTFNKKARNLPLIGQIRIIK